MWNVECSPNHLSLEGLYEELTKKRLDQNIQSRVSGDMQLIQILN